MKDYWKLTREQLSALVEHPARLSFDEDMQSAQDSIVIYVELMKKRGITDQFQLKLHEHQDVAATLKSTLINSLSALDALVHAHLASSLAPEKFEKVRYKTYQSTKQIVSALRLLSIKSDFSTIAPFMSSDFYTPSDVARILDSNYARKNFMTHHADRDFSGDKLEYTASDAVSCVRFVRDLGLALHSAWFVSNNSFKPNSLRESA